MEETLTFEEQPEQLLAPGTTGCSADAALDPRTFLGISPSLCCLPAGWALTWMPLLM